MNAFHCSVSFTIWNCFLSAMLIESTCHKCIYGEERECENASTLITNLIWSFKCSFMDMRCAAMSLKTAQQTLACRSVFYASSMSTFTDRFGHEHGSIRLNCPMAPYRAQLLTWKIDQRFIAIRHRFDFHKHFIIFRTNRCLLHRSLIAMNKPINQNELFNLWIYELEIGRLILNQMVFFFVICVFICRVSINRTCHTRTT